MLLNLVSTVTSYGLGDRHSIMTGMRVFFAMTATFTQALELNISPVEIRTEGYLSAAKTAGT